MNSKLMNYKMMNARFQYLFLGIVCSLCLVSCLDDDNDTDWTESVTVEVDSKIVPCYVWGAPDTAVDGMRIRPVGASEWSMLPVVFIEGFHFEEGYSYVLQIEIKHLADPPQDGYNVRYKLIREISKEKDS